MNYTRVFQPEMVSRKTNSGETIMQSRKTVILEISLSVLFLMGVIFLARAEAKAPDNPTIAVSTNAAEGNIWLMDPNGNNQRELLLADGQPLGLEWSPDGTRLAFHTESKKNIDVYVVNGDGGNLKQLTDHAAEDSWPNWHPDGRKLVFSSDRDGNFEIYTMNAAGQIIENLTNDPADDIQPAWSRDARKIAFSSKRGKTIGDLYLIDGNGGNLQNLTNHRAKDSYPAWSPDSEKIAWITERSGHAEIFVMGADGRNQIKIGCCRDPEWSPDGKELAATTFGGGVAKIIIQDADGKGNRREIPTIGNFNRAAAWFDPDFVTVFSVSPAGKRALAWGWLKQIGRNE